VHAAGTPPDETYGEVVIAELTQRQSPRMTSAPSSTTTHNTRPPSSSLRVRPASKGAWRVEDEVGTRELCATFSEAEKLAERLVHEVGAGQILVYDAYLRLRTVKRLPPAAV
jgi:hypothetical protein